MQKDVIEIKISAVNFGRRRGTYIGTIMHSCFSPYKYDRKSEVSKRWFCLVFQTRGTSFLLQGIYVLFSTYQYITAQPAPMVSVPSTIGLMLIISVKLRLNQPGLCEIELIFLPTQINCFFLGQLLNCLVKLLKKKGTWNRTTSNNTSKNISDMWNLYILPVAVIRLLLVVLLGKW